MMEYLSCRWVQFFFSCNDCSIVFLYNLYVLYCQLSCFMSFSFVWPLDGNVVSASTLDYFIIEFSVSVCTFLFEETYFDSRKQLHFRVFGYCVCVCQAANPAMTSRYLCLCLCVCVCVSVSEFPSQWPTKLKIRITVLFNYWMFQSEYIYIYGHTLTLQHWNMQWQRRAMLVLYFIEKYEGNTLKVYRFTDFYYFYRVGK